MAYYACRCVLPSRFVTRQVMLLQPQKLALRKSNPVLFQLSLSRFYTNSTRDKSRRKMLLRSSPNTPLSSFLDKNLGKIGKELAKRLPSAILAHLVVSGITGLIAVDLLIAWGLNKYNKHLLIETVKKGTRPDVGISNDKLVPRPEIVENLKKILQPEDQSFYHVVCGEHGTGKTTLIRIASREAGQDKDKGKQGGMGVIYVEVPAETENIEDFGKAFGKSLNFSFEEHISYTAQFMRKIFGDTNGKDERPKWKRALEAFKCASEVYKKKYKKPPVIVYDNIAKLINVNPKVLDTLQDDAKMNADSQGYIAVFVSSEGSVPQRMESRSAWSRAEKPVIEIGDLGEEESIKYLTEKRGINEEEAKRLYELVGGRIVDLKTVASKSLDGQKFEVIEKQILIEIEKKFKTAQLYEDQQLHEAGTHVIKALLNSKELDYLEFRKIFKSIAKTFDPDETLGKNVFAYHPEKNTVTFQSQSVEYYIRKKINIYTINKNQNTKK